MRGGEGRRGEERGGESGGGGKGENTTRSRQVTDPEHQTYSSHANDDDFFFFLR